MSNKKNLKKTEPAPECEEHHRHWHLPYIEHCSDVDEAFDEVLDDEVIVEEGMCTISKQGVRMSCNCTSVSDTASSLSLILLASSKKKLKKKELTPECEEHRVGWHLPAIHCSDVEEALEGLE